MIFTSLSLSQNILFILSAVSLLILISYLILLYSGYVRTKNKISSDDFDDVTDDFKTTSFLFNTFKIKGTVFFLSIATTVAFLLSLFTSLVISISVALLVAFGLAVLMGYLERVPLADNGEFGIVTKTIPEKSKGLGKVLLINSDCGHGAIKKGKKVIIIENIGNKVFVKKIKRSGKK